MRVRRLVLVAIVVVLAACGSSSKKGAPPGDTKTPALSTELGTGVTANEIKLGISITDFDCIKQYVDSIFPDQEPIYQAFIDDINKKGGINGRKIVPVMHSFCPIPDPARLASICTSSPRTTRSSR